VVRRPQILFNRQASEAFSSRRPARIFLIEWKAGRRELNAYRRGYTIVNPKIRIKELSRWLLSIEERILCAADKFYSKDPEALWAEKPLARIRAGLSRWGPAVLERWDAIEREFLTEIPRAAQA
jgi:hypothetical protein